MATFLQEIMEGKIVSSGVRIYEWYRFELLYTLVGLCWPKKCWINIENCACRINGKDSTWNVLLHTASWLKLIFCRCVDRIVHCRIRPSRHTTDIWYLDTDYSCFKSCETTLISWFLYLWYVLGDRASMARIQSIPCDMVTSRECSR